MANLSFFGHSRAADPDRELCDLLASARTGNRDDYRIFLKGLALRVRAYHSKSLRRFVHFDESSADDLTQDTLIAVHAKLPTYDDKQPLMPWVIAIARYKFIDHLRRLGSSVHWEELGDRIDLFVDEPPADERIEIQQLLESLPVRDRQLIVLTKLEGQPVLAAAKTLGMTEGAAKVAIHRALKTLARIGKARIANSSEDLS